MLRCPADATPLTAHHHGTTRFGACPTCHGLWFERDRALASTARDHAFAPPDDEAGGRPARSVGAAAPHHGPRHCARCRQPLRPRFVAEVELDVCPRCAGLWLDAGEFQAIRGWYAREGPGRSGGKTVKPAAQRRQSAASSDIDGGSIGAMDVIVEFVGEVVIDGSVRAVATFVGNIFDGLFDNLLDNII